MLFINVLNVVLKKLLPILVGNKYNKQRSTSIFPKLFKWKHRHVVFTIPDELRIYFRQDRKRLNYLFDASSITIKYWFKEKYKKYDLIPAYISILHTFGRSLIFNPHIHMILLDGGISNESKQFIKCNFFSYPSFRKRFMKVLLDMLEEDIGKDEKIYIFKCTKCHKLDPVPSFILNEHMGFLKFIKKKDKPKMDCPYCGNTMLPIDDFK